MRPRMRTCLSAVMLIVILASACRLLPPTPIGKVLENPATFRQVVVSGVVTERIGAFGWNAYVLRDETGEIKVMARGVLPRICDRVRVAGQVKDVVVLGDFQVIVLVEAERKRPLWSRATGTTVEQNSAVACQILISRAFVRI